MAAVSHGTNPYGKAKACPWLSDGMAIGTWWSCQSRWLMYQTWA